MRKRERERQEEAIARFGDRPGAARRGRIRMATLAFTCAFGVLAFRLLQLHLSPDLELTVEEKLHIGQVMLKEPRGNIFDRDGLILATDRQTPSIWVDPRKVQEPQTLALLLSARLGMDEDEVLEKITLRDEQGNPRKHVWLKRWVMEHPPEVLEALVVESGGAVALQYEAVRYYPHGSTAAHLLGFVNRAGDASEGVERQFDDHLRSIPGVKMARKDARRRLMDSLTVEYSAPQGGDMLQLTIDSAIQHALEEALDERMEFAKAPRAMGIVMEPNSGAILALASRPTFDPNQYDGFEAELRKNRAILDVFEPGSAFKIVTAAAALEHGLVTPDTLIDCENGSFNPYGHRIKDFHRLGVEPFSKCFEESSNIALIKVAAMLGPERLDTWIRSFGFGAASSRDFPGESRGIYRSRDKWSRLSMGSLPMGQEISVTMTQMARAYAVIANGGHVVEPYFVERAVNKYGEVTYQHDPGTRRRILSEATCRTMRDLCSQVVDLGTGKLAVIPEYTVGGKTGTAQMARLDGRGYDPDRWTTIFCGFAPAVDPRLVAVIVVQEPKIKLAYGGYVCGPVFSSVVREALVRLNVPPDKVVEKTPEKVAKNAPVLRSPARAIPELIAQDADTISERIPVEELEESLAALLEPLDDLALRRRDEGVSGGGAKLPDFSGMTKLQAKERLADLGVAWDYRGSGWVIAQDPPAGTPLDGVVLCALEFSTVPQEVADEEPRNL